jgi:transposase InsO family protein
VPQRSPARRVLYRRPGDESVGTNGVAVPRLSARRSRPRGGRRAGELLDRDFTAGAPNTKWVTDFTYVRSWAGFVYVAFILDCFSQRIVAWHASTSKTTDLVMTPLRMALWDRDRHGHPIGRGDLIHHSDAWSQGGFNWSSQHLDVGGVVRWQDAGKRARIGLSGQRCGLRGDHHRGVRWHGSSGGASPLV